MPAVTGSDLRRVLAVLDVAYEASASAPVPFPLPTLTALSDLIPAEEVSYFELRRAGRTPGATAAERDQSVVAHSTTGIEEIAGLAEALAAFGHENPVSAVLSGFGPAHGPVLQSRVIDRPNLERLDFYDAFLRPARIHDVLKVWLTSPAETVACISFERAERDFTERDVVLLRILQTHLDAIHTASMVRSAAGLSEELKFTPRQAEVLVWAARGKRDEEIAELLCISPATVRKHLKNVYEQLEVHSRAEAVARVMLARTGN